MVPPSIGPATAGPAVVRKTASYRFAKLGDRFIAFLLDTMVLFGVFAIIDAWVFMRWGTIEGAELRLTSASLLIAGTLNAAILFAYGWLLEAGFGATLGKAIVGIRVVRTTQRNALSALAIRNVLRIVDGLGFYVIGGLVAGCSSLHQRLGDICAGTAVIEEESGSWIKALAVLLWMAVLGGAFWAVPRICTETYAGQPPRYLSQIVVQVGGTETSAYMKVASVRIDVQLGSGARR
jgi:uncharacterized RDD family membrane protein YckC